MTVPDVLFVPIARPTFDVAWATEQMTTACARLVEAGMAVRGPADLVMAAEAAEAAAREAEMAPPDLVVLFQASFADSTMAQRVALATTSPVLLWAVPEPRTGGRLRLNSLCGINLAAHALRRQGRAYHTAYTPANDTATVSRVAALARAGYARRRLAEARLGLVGVHPDGFETCDYDADELRTRLGLTVVPLSLETVFDAARAVRPQAAGVIAELGGRVGGLDALAQEPLHGTAAVAVALRQQADVDHLNALAVRCWPEFFTQLGCAACGALSLLTDQGTPCSCEADVNGTATLLLLQYISGGLPFIADLVDVDREADTAVLWHCGLAPLGMADPSAQPTGGLHSNRKLPLVMEFPLKPGRVTLARLSHAEGWLRLVIGGGEMMSAPPSFQGTSGVIRFDRPAGQVLDTILAEGLEHHICLTYGDHRPALRALADLLALPVLELC